MDRMDAFRLAVAELGNVPPDRLVSFIQTRFGVAIDARFVPIFQASLRDLENLGRSRPAAPPAPTPASPVDLSLPAGIHRFKDVRQLAQRLIVEHGLENWRFAYNRRKQAMGLCVYQRRTIELSVHFVQRNESPEIVDTLLHEIAHALVGPGHGHDAVWKRQCLQVGARPQRCGVADMPEGRWQARCPSCGKMFHRHRQPKRLQGWFCRPCGPERGRIAWSEALE